MKDLMQITSDVEEIFGLSSFKLNLISKFKMYCMRCFKKSVGERKIKTYKDPNLFKSLQVRHLEHYVCDECEKQRIK